MKKQNFVFFDTGSGDESGVLRVTEGVNLMAIQVSGESGYDLTVYGQTDMETDEWCAVGGISLSDFSKVSNITDNGIYYFPISAFHTMRMENDGTTGGVKVHGWLVD